MFPSNEEETIALFKLMQNHLGWRIVHQQIKFPDLIIENGNEVQLSAEAEHLARNFKLHNHDPEGCDLVICYHNDWPDAPLPVWALEDCVKEESLVIQQLLDRRQSVSLLEAAEDLNHFIGQLHRIRLGLEAEIVNLRDGNRLLMRVDELQVENARLRLENKRLQWRQFEPHAQSYLGGVQLYTELEEDTRRFKRLLNKLSEIPEAVDLIRTDAKAYHDLNCAIEKGDWEALEFFARGGYYKPKPNVLQYPGAERLAEFVDKLKTEVNR